MARAEDKADSPESVASHMPAYMLCVQQGIAVTRQSFVKSALQPVLDVCAISSVFFIFHRKALSRPYLLPGYEAGRPQDQEA